MTAITNITKKLKMVLTKQFWTGFERCAFYPHLRNRQWAKSELEEQARMYVDTPHRPEYIVAVAMRRRDTGIVYATMRPGRHFHTIRWLVEKGFDSEYIGYCQQGFMTNRNRYLSREEARALAIKNGQVLESDLVSPSHIFSEDLWDTPIKYQHKE